MGLLDGDLARSIYSGFKGKLLSGIIRHKVIPTSGGLDSRGDPITSEPVDTDCEGFIEDYSDYYKAQAGIPTTDLKVNIFAQSIPGMKPGKDDVVRLGSVWYQLRSAATDPATALWVCRAYEIEEPA